MTKAVYTSRKKSQSKYIFKKISALDRVIIMFYIHLNFNMKLFHCFKINVKKKICYMHLKILSRESRNPSFEISMTLHMIHNLKETLEKKGKH